MLKYNNRLDIKLFLLLVFLLIMLLFGMGTIPDTNAMDLICMVSTSPGLSDDGIINNFHITKEGYIAATNEILLDRAIRLAISGNRHKLREFLLENPFVFYLRANLWAQIEHRSWPGKIKIKLMDYNLSVWTIKEAIE